MKPCKRKKLRQLAKGRVRQAAYRDRQKEKGLTLLQVRISRLAHSKAMIACEALGISTTAELYELAINSTNANKPPKKHAEVTSGDLVGSIQICPWLSSIAISKFESIAKEYRTRNIAISAIVYAYCESVNVNN